MAFEGERWSGMTIKMAFEGERCSGMTIQNGCCWGGGGGDKMAFEGENGQE